MHEAPSIMHKASEYQHCGAVARWLCGWLYGCMAIWPCGFMSVLGLRLHGYWAMWLCGHVTAWLRGHMAVWLYGYMVIHGNIFEYRYDYMARWLCCHMGYIDFVQIPQRWAPIDPSVRFEHP